MPNISYREYLTREYKFTHAPFEPEMEFYNAISSGQISKVKSLCQSPLSEKEGLGILSKNDLRNMKYHFAITVAMIARQCIKAGLTLSESYSMSDFYIESADRAKNISEIDSLHTDMCLAYAKKMRQYSKKTIYSKPIIKCIEYIYDNLHTRITIPTLCDVCGLSEAYLSRLFKKETGTTISAYILYKKLETAQSMLLYSDHSIAEISSALAFPSQSYFTNAFKKENKVTPLEYRKQMPNQ